MTIVIDLAGGEIARDRRDPGPYVQRVLAVVRLVLLEKQPAQSQEFGQDGGSARGWADKTIGSRVYFNDDKRRFIYEMIDLLDSKLGAND